MALFGADEAFDIEESPRKNAIEARRVLRMCRFQMKILNIVLTRTVEG